MDALLIPVLLLGLAISFLMSGMEAGVFALSRLRVRQQMRAGNPRAKTLNTYLENPENFLWTILVGNVVASFAVMSITVTGIHQGLRGSPGWAFAALLAAGTLFYTLCELFPKMLFRLYPNRLCLLMGLPFGIVHLLLRPLVALVAWLANLVLRWFGGRPLTGQLFGNRDEMRLVMQESAQGMTSEERAMINRVLDLQNLTVQQIAIPLSKVASVSTQTSIQELITLGRERGLVRFPVWKSEGARQRIVGLVNLVAVLYQSDLDLNKTASDYLKPALYLVGSLRLEIALRQMQHTGQRLAVVLAPDKSELGIISLQDILKVIFGEVSL